MQQQRGFTLIELSIVLVIIALIVGGVMVGQHLIKVAAIQSQITQIQQYRTAISTFRVKYNGFPGDITPMQATSFNMATRTGAAGRGDGNGKLNSCAGSSGSSVLFGCENALFWNDLGIASLIPNTYPLNTDSYVAIAQGQVGNYLPLGKIGNGNYLTAFNSGGPGFGYGGERICSSTNCFSLFGIAGTVGNEFFGVVTDAALHKITPAEAYAIDSKIDDGMPLAGQVVGGNINFLGGIDVMILSASCGTYNAGAPLQSTYSWTSSSANTPSCVMNFTH